jgi:Ca2+-binding EF-hand superfamily protein
MAALNVVLSEAQLRDLMRSVGVDISGQLNRMQFAQLVTRGMAPPPAAAAQAPASAAPLPSATMQRDQLQRARQLFDRFDTLKKGRLAPRDLHTALGELGFRLSFDDAQALLRSVDKDHSGTLDFDEFVVLILNGANPAQAAQPTLNKDQLQRGRTVFRQMTFDKGGTHCCAGCVRAEER